MSGKDAIMLGGLSNVIVLEKLEQNLQINSIPGLGFHFQPFLARPPNPASLITPLMELRSE